MTETLAAQIEALAPCPFCGNDGSGPIEHALHVCFHELDWRDNAWSVQCDKCTATMGYSDSEEEAIAAWNTRPAIVTALRQAEAAPGVVEAVDDKDLRAWGFAPGGYIFKCHDCPEEISIKDRFTETGDKRSWRCEKHAREARDAFRANLAASVPKRSCPSALAHQHGAREDAHEPIRTSDPTAFAASDKTKLKSEKVRLPAAPATDVGEGK